MPYKTYSDQELLDTLKSGDRNAFKEIYNRHWEPLLHSAFRILEDKDACFDVLQEVFVWFWENRQTLEVRSIKAYLLMAVRYQVANYIRKGKVRQAYLDRNGFTNTESSYEVDDLEVKELKKIISDFTQGLPERCKQIFHLSRNEHLNNKEIAQKLGLSEKTVENQLTIALKRLKIKLGNQAAFLFFFV